MASPEELVAAITAKGSEIREAKTGGAAKDAIGALVKDLLDLKAAYKVRQPAACLSFAVQSPSLPMHDRSWLTTHAR